VQTIAKRKLGKDVQVKLRNPEIIERDGTFVEDDSTYEIESIVSPNKGDRGWTDDSNLIKLKGRDELFEPKDLLNATPKKRTSGKKGEPVAPAASPPQQPTKTVEDLAKSSLSGEDITVTLEQVREAFLKNQGGDQGNTVAPNEQELAKQLGFELDENGIIQKDSEGNAVTSEIDQEALKDFFAVNDQMLNDPTAQQLALMRREEKTDPANPAAKNFNRQIPLPADGEVDILNILQDTVGRIKTKEPDKNIKPSEAMERIKKTLMHGPARFLMGGTRGRPIDTVIEDIKDQVSIDTTGGDAVEILAEMIDEAIARRIRLNEENKEVTAFNNYISALTENDTRARNQNATRAISAADLVVGDMFKVKGKWVEVTDLNAEGFLLEL
jgi:hypothetical protein